MCEQKCCYLSSRDYEDCRYYSVTFDMGANIPHCVLNPPSGMEALSYCPCIDNKGKCNQYISKKDPNGDFIAGQQRMVDRVLEIIDDMCRDEDGVMIALDIQWIHAKTLINKIKALQGGEQ